MPFAIGSSGSAGGNFTASGFSKQLTIPVPADLSAWTTILNHQHPLKVILFNLGESNIVTKFDESDELESAIIIPPGTAWIEIFASVKLIIKSDNQANARLTIFTDTLPDVVESEMPFTPLEVVAGEPFTGIEVTSVPSIFTLKIRRENLGIPIDASSTAVDIYLHKMHEPITLPVAIESLWEVDGYVHTQYFNDSQIWETTVTINDPGLYFFGSYYNWAGSSYIARLEAIPGINQVEVLSEIEL